MFLTHAVTARIEECLVVYLPKYASIENFGLGVLLLLLRIGAVLWIAYLAKDLRPYNVRVVPVGGMVRWVDFDSTKYALRQWDDWTMLEVCNPTTAERFRYQYDEAGKWVWGNFSCMDLPEGERFVKGESEIFIPTFVKDNHVDVKAVDRVTSGWSREEVQEDCLRACGQIPARQLAAGKRVYRPSGSLNALGQCLCEAKQETHSFVTGVGALQLAFDHSIDHVPPDRPRELYSSTNASHALLTVVHGHADKGSDALKEVSVIHPPESVMFTLDDILQFSSASLDDHFLGTNENYLCGVSVDCAAEDVSQFPLARMTGMNIDVTLKYHNLDDRGWSRSAWSNRPMDHQGPVCLVQFSTAYTWSSKMSVDYGRVPDSVVGEGSYRYRVARGVTFRFHQSGYFSYFDVTGIFFFIGTSWVYLTIPTTLVMFVAHYGLGSLSAVFRSGTLERLNVLVLLRGMLCRSLMAYNSLSCFANCQHLLGCLHVVQQQKQQQQEQQQPAAEAPSISSSSSRQQQLQLQQPSVCVPPSRQPQVRIADEHVMGVPTRDADVVSSREPLQEWLQEVREPSDPPESLPVEACQRKSPSIGVDTLEEQLKDLFPCRSSEEIVMMRRLVMLSEVEESAASLLEDVTSRSQRSASQGLSAIDLVDGCINNEPVSLEQLVPFFDHNRRGHFIERLFDSRSRRSRLLRQTMQPAALSTDLS